MHKALFKRISKLNITLMLWLLIIFVGSLTAFASENKITVSADKNEYVTNDSIVLKFNLNGDKKVSAFIIEAEYPSGIIYSTYERSSAVKSGYSDIYDNGGKVSFVYAFKDNVPLNPSENILTLKFKVTENIEGEGEIKVNIKGVLDEKGNKLVSDSTGTLKFTANPPKEEVKVTKLVPSAGTLNPSFSSDTYKYTMSVPYSVDSITFDIEYTGEAKASVNRKNLGSGGSTSEFIITVTPINGEKIIYTVNVTRGEYVRPSSGNSSSTSKGSESTVSQEEIIVTDKEEIINIVESGNEANSEGKTNSGTIIIEEPETNITANEDNSFSAFVLGAVTMLFGIGIGLLCVFIFKKIKK